MINHFLNYLMLIFCILSALLSGCSAPEPTASFDQMDKSPFTGNPCAAPCFHGLVIGESNEQAVISTLSTLHFINPNTITTSRRSMPKLDLSAFAPGIKFYVDCSYPTNTQCLSMTVVEDILTEINFTLNYKIRVDEAIEYLGNPDYVGYQNLGAEKILCEVDLIWRSKQLVLATTYEGYKSTEENCGVVRDTGKPLPDSSILEVRYVSLAEIDRLLSPGTNIFYEYSGFAPEK